MSGRTVAVVDDNIHVVDALKLVLEVHGFRVASYASSAAFLDDLATRPACLIVDQNMPKMTGLELVAWLRERGNRVPVMLTTGAPIADLAESAARLDIAVVLRKPTELEDLLTFVSAYC